MPVLKSAGKCCTIGACHLPPAPASPHNPTRLPLPPPRPWAAAATLCSPSPSSSLARDARLMQLLVDSGLDAVETACDYRGAWKEAALFRKRVTCPDQRWYSTCAMDAMGMTSGGLSRTLRQAI